MGDPLVRGLPPVWRDDARLLILGSMPSVVSLAESTYYGNPRNAFWPIMAALFGIDAAAPTARRYDALREARVALWDVVGAARRPGGSADAAIRDVEPNPIGDLLARMPDCRMVALNGRKAEELWRRHVVPTLEQCIGNRELSVHALPSTSPAHAARSPEQKLSLWRAALAVG